VAAVDEAVTAQMRQILHDPAFQGLEAAWRGLRWLLARMQDGETAQVRLLDISKAELALDLATAGDNLQASGVYKLLVESGVQTAGGEPWSLLLGNYTFDASEADVRLLTALGAVAALAGGPFLAAASPRFWAPAAWPRRPTRTIGSRWTRRHMAAGRPCAAAPRRLGWVWPCRASCSACRTAKNRARPSSFPFEELPDKRAAMTPFCGAIRAAGLRVVSGPPYRAGRPVGKSTTYRRTTTTKTASHACCRAAKPIFRNAPRK